MANIHSGYAEMRVLDAEYSHKITISQKERTLARRFIRYYPEYKSMLLRVSYEYDYKLYYDGPKASNSYLAILNDGTELIIQDNLYLDSSCIIVRKEHR